MKKRLKDYWRRLRGLDGDMKTATILLLLGIISCISFTIIIMTAGFVPFNIIAIVLIVVAIIFGMLYFLIFKQKIRHNIKVFSEVMCVIMMVILLVASFYIHATHNLFNRIQVSDTEKVEYSVLIKKNNSKTKGLGYIANKVIGFYKDDNTRKVKDYLKPLIIERAGGDFGMQFVENSSLYNLGEQFLKGENKIEVVCLSQAQIQILSEELKGFKDQIKSIYNFQLDSPTYRAGQVDNVAYENPFIIYLSVTEQSDLQTDIYNGEKPHEDYDINLRKFRQATLGDTHGYSEINRLLVVNPRTNRILILNIPADYYIQLDKEGKKKDTLSDTGLMGIQEGIEGLEQLLGVRIQYYLKTTFDDLLPLAQEVGETDLDLSSETRKQEILDKISNKLTSSDVLWRNYSPILMVAGNAFQTDMPSNLLADLLKRQITTHAWWEINGYSLEGTAEEQSLYFLGNDEQKTQVLMPNDESVESAKEKIQSIMGEI